MTSTIDTGAEFSPCGKYRYALWRQWGDGSKGFVAFIGVNPSTADELTNDPTVAKCIGYAKQWGYDGMFMLNLFGLRSTDPSGLKKTGKPVGPANDDAIKRYVSDPRTKLIVCCWGEHGKYLGRGWFVCRNILQGFKVKCLGVTKAGRPKHPLYLPGILMPEEFEI
jgi:hypothetical protein